MKFLDVNQHLSELDEHIKVLKSYGDVFEEVEARITRVINMDGAFKGEGAQGVIYNHAHMQLPTIRSIRAFLISFSETLEKMKAKITEYEPASNGSVSEAFWKNQLPKAYDRYEETLEERETAINQATAEVSHILHLGKLQTGDVYNSVDSARKHADTVLEGLYDLDQAGVELMAQVRTKMEELKATIRQVLDWNMTGGVTMKGVSIMEVGGYFANNATLHEKAPAVDTSKVSAGVHDPALAGNPAYMISYQACSFNDWANPELREDYELIYESENTSSASIGQEVGSAVLDFIPVVGNIKAGVEAVIGKDLITGRELEDWERALAGAAIMGGPIVKGASRGAKLVNNVNKANDVAKNIDNIKLSPSHYPNPDPPMHVPPVRYEPKTIEEVMRMRRGKGPTTRMTHGDRNIEAHHRQQIPVRNGGILDELEQRVHRGGGNHSRHDKPSQLTPSQRAKEIREHYKKRGSEYLLPGEGI